MRRYGVPSRLVDKYAVQLMEDGLVEATHFQGDFSVVSVVWRKPSIKVILLLHDNCSFPVLAVPFRFVGICVSEALAFVLFNCQVSLLVVAPLLLILISLGLCHMSVDGVVI